MVWFSVRSLKCIPRGTQNKQQRAEHPQPWKFTFNHKFIKTLYTSGSQPLLRGPQVLREQSFSAPKKFEIHNLVFYKMKFLSRYDGFSIDLLSGAPRPLKGWETLLYAFDLWVVERSKALFVQSCALDIVGSDPCLVSEKE